MKPGMSNEASFWCWVVVICIAGWALIALGAVVALEVAR